MATSSAVGNDRYLSEENRESSNAQHSVGHPSVNNADQDATIELPFHGSCPRCHHLHTNTGLRYFCNLKKHLRMKCEHCHHEMFGLGSDSTQTSLASEETLSRQNSWFSIRSSCTNVPRGSTIELDPTRLAQPPQDLGTIAETISLDGRSVISGHRSASSLAAERVPGSGNGGVSRAQSVTITSPSIAEGSVSAIRKGSEGTLEGGNQPQTTTPSQRFRKWKDKISYWIGRIGEWKGTKIEMTLTLGRVSPTVKISRVPTGENPHASICQVKESQPPQVEHATTSVNTSSIHPLQAATADPVDEKPAAEPSDAAVELAEEESHLRVAKRQRISVQRREKTLKKKAMGKPGSTAKLVRNQSAPRPFLITCLVISGEEPKESRVQILLSIKAVPGVLPDMLPLRGRGQTRPQRATVTGAADTATLGAVRQPQL
ncbi:hypothetical protein MMC08_007460 [Hypocenomyce scalaris]|nr:hypothetical protein [Hypocenomyce scalaris]